MEPVKKNICVYCSSSDAVGEQYFSAAKELGKCLAQKNYELVYGGGGIGLMGAVARSVHQYGGKVVGVIPESLNLPGITYEETDRLIVTRTMRERKAIMEERAEAFIGLPGGFGTLEEMLEIITLKQIRAHTKPVVFLDTGDFYRQLIDFFEHLYREQFTKSMYRQLYYIAPDARSALSHIENYEPPRLSDKWY